MEKLIKGACKGKLPTEKNHTPFSVGKIKAEILHSSHQAAGSYLQKSHQCYFCRQFKQKLHPESTMMSRTLPTDFYNKSFL